VYRTNPLPRLMWPVLEIRHIEEVRNEWSYTSTPTVCLHGMQWEYAFKSREANWFLNVMQMEYGVHPTSCPMDVGGLYPEDKLVGGRAVRGAARVYAVILHALNLGLIKCRYNFSLRRTQTDSFRTVSWWSYH